MPVIPTGPQSGKAAQTIGNVASRFQQREQAIAAREQQKQQHMANMQQRQAEMQQQSEMQALQLQLKQQEAAQAREAQRQQFEFNKAATNIKLASEYGQRVEGAFSKEGGPVTYKGKSVEPGFGKAEPDVGGENLQYMSQVWPEFVSERPEFAKALAGSGKTREELFKYLVETKEKESAEDQLVQHILAQYPEFDEEAVVSGVTAGMSMKEVVDENIKQTEKKREKEALDLLVSGSGSPEEIAAARATLGVDDKNELKRLAYLAASSQIEEMYGDAPETKALIRQQQRDENFLTMVMAGGLKDGDPVVVAYKKKIKDSQERIDEARAKRAAALKAFGGKEVMEIYSKYLYRGALGVGGQPEPAPRTGRGIERGEPQGGAQADDDMVGMLGQAAAAAPKPESATEKVWGSQQSVGLAGQPQVVRDEPNAVVPVEGQAAPTQETTSGEGVPSGPPPTIEQDIYDVEEEDPAEEQGPAEKPPVNQQAVREAVDHIWKMQPGDKQTELAEEIFDAAFRGDPESIAVRDQLLTRLKKEHQLDILENIIKRDPRVRDKVMNQYRDMANEGSKEAEWVLQQLSEKGWLPPVSLREKLSRGDRGQLGETNPETARKWGDTGDAPDTITLSGAKDPISPDELARMSVNPADKKEKQIALGAYKKLRSPKYRKFLIKYEAAKRKLTGEPYKAVEYPKDFKGLFQLLGSEGGWDALLEQADSLGVPVGTKESIMEKLSSPSSKSMVRRPAQG